MTALKAVTASSGARRRMVSVAALAAGAALVLSGCSAGQIAQTATQVAAVNGNHADIDRIALRNVHIVFPVAGSEYTNTKGGKAIIALSIINNGETVTDELTSISTDLGTVKITPPAGDPAFRIAPQQTVVAATTAAAAQGTAAKSDEHGATPSSSATPTTAAPSTSAKPDEHGAGPAGDKTTVDPEKKPGLIEITGLSKDITPGLTYPVTFNFKQNGTVTVQVPVDAGPLAERHEDGKAAAPEGGH
ncbi:hypothetical protein [Nocardia sp. NBC_00565]|uniref:hypothetical protein n=1 Tax=Nocardia sp. NBC_00565 TaxID=2975993 RepID=UPI002E81B542|nr:hypothetical protein [Nocardia sp. NBC_00565]